MGSQQYPYYGGSTVLWFFVMTKYHVAALQFACTKGYVYSKLMSC